MPFRAAEMAAQTPAIPPPTTQKSADSFLVLKEVIEDIYRFLYYCVFMIAWQSFGVRCVSCAFEWIGSIKRTQSGTDMPHSERASLGRIIDAQHLLEWFPRVYRGAQCKLRFEMHL
jgi:hypothetical protein